MESSEERLQKFLDRVYPGSEFTREERAFVSMGFREGASAKESELMAASPCGVRGHMAIEWVNGVYPKPSEHTCIACVREADKIRDYRKALAWALDGLDEVWVEHNSERVARYRTLVAASKAKEGSADGK